MTNRSVIFTHYNRARRLVRERRLDPGRLNRGLGLALRKGDPEYRTTLTYCSCPDFSGVAPNGRRFRAVSDRPCKHIIALALRGEA